MAKVCPSCGNTYDDKNVFCPTDGSTLRSTGEGADLVGSVIADRYLVTEKLGEGGMGRVYLAQHVRLPQQAAIKVLNPALVNDTEALARFNHEASNACRINDTHVARVYDFGETGSGLVYLAMEYVPGQTLTALLTAGAPFDPARVDSMTRQIAGGLDAAHKLGIVHRDLKPDNILVTRESDGGELLKIVDFGIAKAIDTAAQSVTKTGFVLGTAQYMSPEQVTGHLIDRRSDVYALGLVTFMMLTGKLPFPGDTAEQMMVMRLTERPRTLAEMRGDIAWPAEVQDVIDGALARDLAHRYPTAGAFAKALSGAIDSWLRRTTAGDEARAVSASEVPSGPRRLEPAPTPVAPPRAAYVEPPSPPVRAGGAPELAPPLSDRRRRVIIAAAAIAALSTAAVIALTKSIDDTQPPVASVDSGVATPDRTLVSDATGGDSARGATPPTPPSPSPTGTNTGTPAGRAPVAGGDPARAGGGNSTAGGGATSAKSQVGGTVTPPVTTALPRVTSAETLRELDAIAQTLDPDRATPGAARSAIASLQALLPKLATPSDSLKANLNRANAHFFLGETAEACTVLRSLEAKASTISRAGIQGQMASIGCDALGSL
jgi:serine/threonine-protein kinase